MRRVAAHILSCPERAAVLANTRALLSATDWAAEARVLINEDQHAHRPERIARGARRLLEGALAEGAGFILALEDDLAFNRHWQSELRPGVSLAPFD